MPVPHEGREPASDVSNPAANPASQAGGQHTTGAVAETPADRQGGDIASETPGRRWGDALGIERDTAPLDE